MSSLFHRFLTILNMLASVWILALVAMIAVDVIGRSLFNAPIHGVPEVAKFSIVAMFWLQMAYVLRVGGHLRTTLGFDLLPQGGKKVVLAANSILGCAVFALIVWLGYPEMMKSWRIGAFEGAGAARIPIWPFWGLLVLGGTLTAIQFLVDFVAAIRGTSRDLEAGDAAAPTTAE